jgi:N-methylhydantoinase A
VGYPSVDVKSVGAGGGSIARVDGGGLLHVGPASAGAVPGPVCYGCGGTEPTVTDASVVLGYLDPEFFLGGAMVLDHRAAETAIREQVAAPLGLGIEEAAAQIIHLATENMVQAIADITVAQGIDPAGAVLIGGGGAAGLNSTLIARRLGCHSLIIPETGAALSAAGALMSDLTAEYAASLFTSTASFATERVNDVLLTLRAQCDAFARRAGDSVLKTGISIIAEARYENQVWDIDMPLEFSRFRTPADIEAFRRAFDAAHERIFTIRDETAPVEIVGLRATVRCQIRKEEDLRLAGSALDHREAVPRQAYFTGHGWCEATIYRLGAIEVGRSYRGPAIIETPFTTIVIDPAASFQRSAAGSIVIQP